MRTKYFFLMLLFLGLGPMSVSAQSASAAGAPSKQVSGGALNSRTGARTSEKLIPMGLAMFLTALREIPADQETNQILRELSDELPPAMSAEKPRFEKLSRARTPAEKARIVDEIIASMRRGANSADVWTIDLGKQWGAALGEAFKITASNYTISRQNFIKGLQGMNWLLESPPKGLPDDVIERIRAVCSYNDETDAISPEFVSVFFKTSLEFVQFMIDEAKKGN